MAAGAQLPEAALGARLKSPCENLDFHRVLLIDDEVNSFYCHQKSNFKKLWKLHFFKFSHRLDRPSPANETSFTAPGYNVTLAVTLAQKIGLVTLDYPSVVLLLFPSYSSPPPVMDGA